MRTKYRCPRCLKTFEDPKQADQHEHQGGIEADPVREIKADDVELEQTGLDEWTFSRGGHD